MGEDREANRFTRRVRRYASVTGSMGGLAARAAARGLGGGGGDDRAALAADLRRSLGGLKGPLMKVAQLLATIPEAVPEAFARELATLQSQAPAMGWPFVRRRMAAELGPDWQGRFAEFGREAVAAASLGQVHKARGHDGQALAVKLQYPDMASAVEADLGQLRLIFALHRRLDGAIDTTDAAAEIAARLREELDYVREAGHMRLYGTLLGDRPDIAVPVPVAALSTGRLLTMSWLDGRPVLAFKDADAATRNRIALSLFQAWWLPFVRAGVIHGDPHLGNYAVRPDHGINLLDYGCVRIFPESFVAGVVQLYRALGSGDEAMAVDAYERWGFTGLTRALVDALNIWARFIYGPLLDDRERSIADGVAPAAYGRREMGEVRRRLQALGPVRPPREFVFMDRAAIGLGAVFLHLGATANWHRLFETALDGFDAARLGLRQRQALAAAGVVRPADVP